MTIAVVLQVGDGVILGADSASTVMDGKNVGNVYFNAEKIANLYKGLPVGVMTWGLGGLRGRSFSSLAKDLRERFLGESGWALDRNAYTIEEVANCVRRFFFEELYLAEYPKLVKDDKGVEQQVFPQMGFAVAGYSAGTRHSEVWLVEVDEHGACNVRQMLQPGAWGAEAKGMPEALMRLVNGWSPRVLDGMVRSGIDGPSAERFLRSLPVEQLVHPGMPIQDALDLVKYLIEVTEGFVRFIPGAAMVHGPIDLAAMTYHEGFRWVQRKHYFPAELNPSLVP